MKPRSPGVLSTLTALFAFASALPAQPSAPASSAPAAASAAPAAAPATGPRAPANLVSPEVAADRRVTFRLFAPEGKKVTVSGAWNNNTPQEMTKDAQGVWSVTTGPIAPGPWIYTFNLDGTDIADPINPSIKLRMRTSGSFVTVPGDGSLAWEARTNVPHGAVDINWHNSKVTNDARPFYVYTPPGYDPAGTTRYPVLYLFHGNNGTPADWTVAGRANFIADNFIDAKKMEPMIIVMPWGHPLPYGAPSAQNNAAFERYMLDEVIPAVESKYRVKTERENRAIMGLSMGGGHALRIGLGNLDRFAWVAGYSAAPVPDFDTAFKALLDDPAGTNAKLKLLWLSCGRQDSLFANNERIDATLTQHKINHTWIARDGFHTFDYWIRCFEETAPLLFR